MAKFGTETVACRSFKTLSRCWLSHKCEPSCRLSSVGSVVTGSVGGSWYLNVIVNRWQVSVISNLKRKGRAFVPYSFVFPLKCSTLINNAPFFPLKCSLLPKKVTKMLDSAHCTVFFINFYANKNVLSGITTTYMLQLMIWFLYWGGIWIFFFFKYRL